MVISSQRRQFSFAMLELRFVLMSNVKIIMFDDNYSAISAAKLYIFYFDFIWNMMWRSDLLISRQQKARVQFIHPIVTFSFGIKSVNRFVSFSLLLISPAEIKEIEENTIIPIISE